MATRAALSISSIALASVGVGWGAHTRLWVSSSMVGGDEMDEGEEDDDDDDAVSYGDVYASTTH